MSKGSAIVAILIAFVGGVAIGNLISGGGDELAGDVEMEDVAAANLDDGVERYNVPVTDKQPQKGPKDALVTVVEVSDFECPFCSRVNPTISRLMNEYKDKVRVVWRNNPLPFHRNAMPAHMLAMEAFEQGGSEKFWAIHDKLFANQRALSRQDLEKYAQEAGLNMAQVKAALDNNEHKATIEADQKLAATMGARGTPHFFINGRKLAGAQPYEKFKEIVDAEIATASGLVEKGTPKEQLYASITKNGLTKEAPQQPAAGAQQPQARRMPDPNAVYKVPVGDQPMKGNANALVTIVEVSDFECPFCGRVNPTLEQIEKEYKNDVRFVWLNNPLPFHRNALPAHIAAWEVFKQGGSDKFWAYHDKLFANQRELTRENLEKWAQEVGGINMAQLKQALDTERHKNVIEQHQTLARSVGATGTPSFFINGRNLRGAQPFAAFKSVIDEELKKAQAKVKAGTPRNKIYEETIKNGATSPQFVGGDAPAAGAAPKADQVYDIAVPTNAPKKGARNAKVIIQEFSDFQCPFCSRVNPTVKQVMEEYGDKITIVWRNYPLPFHQQAHPAAQAAMEVYKQGGDAKFWAYHDKLFANQRALSRQDLEKYAEEIGGINMAQFRQALDTQRHKAAVDADLEAVKKAGARIGTPSFFINGRLLQGAQPFPAFKAAIDKALEEAK